MDQILIIILPRKWHQITNPFDETCHLIEIQYGEACVEEDIERIDYYKAQ